MNREAKRRNSRVGLTRFFVPDPAFRWYIRALGFGALGIGAFFGVLSWWYHRRLLESVGLPDLLADPSVGAALSDYSTYSLTITAVAAVGTVLFVTLLSVFLLHRISGPIYRLRMHMQEIMAGCEPSEVSFRKEDQLSDLSLTFNRFLRHVKLVEGKARADAPPEAAQKPLPLEAKAEV